ncbi:unnamed protein product, partial [Prunus brigantina]
GFLDPTGDKNLAWSSCYNSLDNLGFEISSTVGPKIEHFWLEFSSLDHCSGGNSFYSDEEENRRFAEKVWLVKGAIDAFPCKAFLFLKFC